MAPRGRPKSNSSQVSDNTLSEVKADVENVVSAKTSVAGTTNIGETLSNDQLMKLVAQLQEQVNTLLAKNLNHQEESEDTYDEDEDFNNTDIRQDDYIKVISLNPFELNLSTLGGGKGKIFNFKTFGSSKRILYSDLVQILENFHHFLENGLFYIADKRVIRRHGLNDLYKKILDKDMIEKILHGTASNDTISIIKSTSKGQQEIIVQLFIDKRLNGEDVDLNFWDKIERATEIPMQEKYDSAKEYLETFNLQQ